jgi:hypothetical protein
MQCSFDKVLIFLRSVGLTNIKRETENFLFLQQMEHSAVVATAL